MLHLHRGFLQDHAVYRLIRVDLSGVNQMLECRGWIVRSNPADFLSMLLNLFLVVQWRMACGTTSRLTPHIVDERREYSIIAGVAQDIDRQLRTKRFQARFRFEQLGIADGLFDPGGKRGQFFLSHVS